MASDRSSPPGLPTSSQASSERPVWQVRPGALPRAPEPRRMRSPPSPTSASNRRKQALPLPPLRTNSARTRGSTRSSEWPCARRRSRRGSMLEHLSKSLVPPLVHATELVGVAIITIGAFATLGVFLYHLLRRE